MGYQFPYAVEAVVFFTCACSYTMDTLQYEFIYQTISEELNFTSNQSVQYCSPNQSQSDIDHAVADRASKWTMYTTLCAYIPCVVGALVLTSWSDKIGRKRAIAVPVAGTLICASFQMVIIVYRLPLYWLIVGEVVYGAMGAYSALLNIGSAHLSDVVKLEDRGRRFTILEVSASVGGGATQIATGYWINASGFIPPSAFIVGCAFLALLFVPLMHSGGQLNDRQKSQDADREKEPLLGNPENDERGYGTTGKDECTRNDFEKDKNRTLLDQLKIVWRIYTTESNGDQDCQPGQSKGDERLYAGRRVWRLWFYALSFSIYMFGVNGVSVFRTMFLVSYPVCFSPGLVGAQAGLGNGLIIAAPFIIIILQNCMKLSGQSIILTGIVARIVSCAVMSIARNPLLVFLATSLAMLYNFTTAFMRSEASRLVSPREQGSVLSVLSGFESFVNIFSPIVFLSLYPATLYISHGFSYLVTALLHCVPFSMMLAVWIANKVIRCRMTHEENTIKT